MTAENEATKRAEQTFRPFLDKAVYNILQIENEDEEKIKDFREKLFDKLTLNILSAQAIEKISKEKGPEELMYSTTGSRYPQNIIYEDEHYQIEGDSSAINYSKLFKYLLFSKDTFEECMGNDLPALKNKIKKDYKKAYKDILSRYKDIIADEKHLYVDFVVQRIAEILPAYLYEADL